MKTATLAEAKDRLDALIEDVRAGEPVVITDGGVPVARLVPEVRDDRLGGRRQRANAGPGRARLPGIPGGGHGVFEALGWAGAILTQVFWIPNIARIVRTRDVQGYSLLAWALMFCGIALFLIYFIDRGDRVAIATNASGVTGAAVTLYCILRWRRRGPGSRTPLDIGETAPEHRQNL